MESLSSQCTPLKQRYDSCFNAWFEGYLQPALDAAQPVPRLTTNATAEPSTPVPPRSRPVTSWAGAFPDSKPAVAEQAPPSTASTHHVPLPTQTRPIDHRGKTRAQIKAQEYEQHCGALWVEYKACLTKAIGENQSLSSLLEQARDEHPLKGLDGLQGTAWDPNTKETDL